MNKIFTVRIRKLILLVFFMLVSITTTWADGSKDLYPSGATGGRATLFSGDKPTINMPFPNRGIHYVYAKVGETIALASSVQAYGTSNFTRNQHRDKVKLYGPNGGEITLSVGNNADTRGNIANRNAEIAGPRLPGQAAGSNRYEAIYHTVTVEGIYRVEFYGTRLNANTANTELTGGRADNVLANSTWTQHGTSNHIWAWDVSVANTAKNAWIKGRVYATVLNMDNSQSALNTSNGFFGEVKVLTRDGYVYNIKNNGQNGLVFTFMVNNRGFHQVGDVNQPSYSSVHGTSLTDITHASKRYSDPNAIDRGSVVTQKIFYNLPDETMPEFAVGAVPGGNTWLRIPEKDLDVTGLKVVGVEGSSNQIGNKGAYIEFTNESGGDYYITIRPKPGSGKTFPVKSLTGPSIIGENKIYWDGTDGNNQLLPSGLSDVEIELKLRGAEVHFPYIDVEQNYHGIIIELLNTNLTGVRSDRVFWNDDAIIDRTRPLVGTSSAPTNASHITNPNGISSNSNGHKWGNGTTTVGAWGDEMGIDTWTFIEGEALTVSFDVDVKIADLYTEIEHAINGQNQAISGSIGDGIEYKVTAGSYGPSDIKGAAFTFTVPLGVDIDSNNINFTTSCGGVIEAEALTYDENSRTFTSKLDLPANCSITYTFTGELSGILGVKTAESTILRPNDVTDPDATNGDLNIPPTNPHFECYNHDTSLGGTSGALSCNNIQESTFTLLDPCTEDLLYFEDFGKILSEENSGRLAWSKVQSLTPTQGGGFSNTRNGAIGGATSSYLFAPGKDDPGYGAANNWPHSNSISVARIKGGYYSVNPPGFVQIGIPETDSWHEGIWVPDAPSNDPTLANSNFDWTPAWDKENTIRDATGAINSSAFLIRGAASASQSIKPFYEIDLPTKIQLGETYTLSMYSYVTYHDKDYMLMDVVDKDTGFVYASIPLTYSGVGMPPNASPEGFSLGWVPLQASFIFDATGCDSSIETKNIKIAIRGSQDRSLESGKGFGHTLIDDISFVKRTSGGLCSVAITEITCEDAFCYNEILGKGYTWHYPDGTSGSTVSETFKQPSTNGGFIMDIYYLDNSFNMIINGVPIHEKELEFQKEVSGSPENVRFKSDGKKWEEAGIPEIWRINGGASIDFEDIHSNPTPALRVSIDKWGNVSLYGIRAENAILEELEVFDPVTKQVVSLDMVHWITDSTDPEANTIVVSQNIVGVSAMTVYGYGQNEKDCETCTIEKDGVFNDENQDGFAHEGETITYTFNVKNAGDMDIHDIEIVDPLLGFVIKLDENTHLPTQEGVTLSGDTNNNGILNRSETWTFTVNYTVTSEDVFTNKGVYNRAEVKGMGRLPNNSTPTHIIEQIMSTDPTPYKEGDLGWDPERLYHTYVPLEGSGLLITNPMIYQKTKNIN